MREPRQGLSWSRRRLQMRRRYADWMESDEWFAHRIGWLQDWVARTGSAPRCLVCDGEWTPRTWPSQHRSYRHLGAERWSELAPYCRPCHYELHRILEAAPGWLRLSRAQATDIITGLLRCKTQR